MSELSAKRRKIEEDGEESPVRKAPADAHVVMIRMKVPPVSKKINADDDTPQVVRTIEDVQKKHPKEFSLEESSESSDVDVVGESEMVIPAATSSGEILRRNTTPSKERYRSGYTSDDEDEADVEHIFSSFPCQLIPETLSRMTKTPIEGERLEVRKNANGRLRIHVVDNCRKYTPYSTMTHRPCIVCSRIMRDGEMHLNFPADLDRRRIWANLLGFKYKDILRSKVGPVSCSVAGGPICSEHFAEECFRNHNFNKAAIEAFGVPVAISPDVKTTPSKKRVPWVCTICEFNTCSVVDLQRHLLEHTENMLRDKISPSEIPSAGFMCPFCRKCTYGYRTVNGFRRHLISPPVHHCHLRRIYDFAKMNCRASELEPMESWDKWTRRNVYVAYHGCEPPVDEIILTPSPTKSTCSLEERTRKMAADAEKRKKAVRTLAFVGKEGGTSVNESNVMQRQVMLLSKRLVEKSKSPEVEEMVVEEAVVEKESEKEPVVEVEVKPKATKSDIRKEKKSKKEEEEIVLPVVPVEPSPKTSRRIQEKVSKSAFNSPVKKVAATASPRSCPSSPVVKKAKKGSVQEKIVEETEQETPAKEEKKVDDSAFQQMVEKRTRAVQRLIRSKNPNQLIKPRKAFASFTVSKTSSSAESSQSDSKVTESAPATSKPAVSAAVKKEDEESNGKETVVEEKEDERPLKSALARSFVAGEKLSMAKYQVPLKSSFSYGVELKPEPKVFVPGFSTKSASFPAPYKPSPVRRLAAGGGMARPNLLLRRPIILSSRTKSTRKPEDEAGEVELLEPEQIPHDNEEIEGEMVEEVVTTEPEPPKPVMTLAEALARNETDESEPVEVMETIAKDLLTGAYYQTVKDAMKTRQVSKLKRDIKISKHCMRQLEAASARARLFGEGEEDRFDIVNTDEGPQLIARRDPEWKQRNQEHGFADEQ